MAKSKSVFWGSDLYKGATVKQNPMVMRLADFIPYQMLEESEKTVDWLKAVADHYEAVGWRNVNKKQYNIQKNYWLRNGVLNPTDYIINPSQNDYYKAVTLVNGSEKHSPLEMFYPLVPNYIDVLIGEYIKRDNTYYVEQIDPSATAEALEFKQEQLLSAIEQQAVAEKQLALMKAGIIENDPQVAQQYQEAIQATIQAFNDTEAKFKTYRTTGAKWAQKVAKIQESRYNLKELGPKGFECGLITDSEYWHLDLLEDDFKLELLNPKWIDSHQGPNIKYVSDGDYFLWFDWGSVGDIINKFGKIMKVEDLEKLKATYSSILNAMIVPDHEKRMQGSYYDASKPYNEAVNMNAPMNDAILGKELAYNFPQGGNFQHSIFDPAGYNTFNGNVQMFRIMRLYFRGMKKIGWLTKIERDGTTSYTDWVDENWKQTVEPKYDFSLTKEKEAKNLIYGEHVEWTWVNDWRHIIKISANNNHSFWKNNVGFKEIYLDGKPVKFQFKGKDNPYESKPPIEGCVYTYLNATANSLVDRLKPFQILYNIAMNKVPKQFLNDYGLKLTIDNRIIPVNANDLEAGISPLEAYDDKLRNSDILDYKLSRETMDGMGQPALPQILDLSTVKQAEAYLMLAQQIKLESGEIVGITRNRLGNNKASETAFGVQQGIQYSETQTEKYFEQHNQLMERVRQRMLDAAQYYSTFKTTSRELYLNDKEENDFLEIEGLKNLLPHYSISLKSNASVRNTLKTLTEFLINENTLPFRASDKIQAIISNSIPEIIDLIKEGDAKMEQLEQSKQGAAQQQQQQQLEAAQQLEAQKEQFTAQQKELDRQSAERIAQIRAGGGIQTDVDANGVLDSQQNMDNMFKQQQLAAQQSNNKANLDQKDQHHIDDMISRQQDRAAKLKIEQDKIKVAKINKNKYDK